MEDTKLRRYLFLTLVALFVLFGPFIFGYDIGLTANDLSFDDFNVAGLIKDRVQTHKEKHFHLIIPATSASQNFCKLLLTAQILRYPEPIVVGWERIGLFDGVQTHLFKITETLAYLRSLPATSDNDMVLVLDGFDVWLELRPDVLLSRYYEVLELENDRLASEGILGRPQLGATVENSVVFGADKLAAPFKWQEAYVWAAPDSSLSKDSFGNETDRAFDLRRPRWLNSGTIMGPVRQMRDVFAASEDAILREANNELEKPGDKQTKLTHSDQFFFGKVWGRQEVNRMKLRVPNGNISHQVPNKAKVPNTEDGSRNEFGICLDQEMRAFQLASGWKAMIDHQMRFDGASTANITGHKGMNMSLTGWTLPWDVQQSRLPFASADPEELPPGVAEKGWDEVPLGANVINKVPFPLFHMTADKGLRESLWPGLWFHPYAELLQKAARREQVQQPDESPETFLIDRDGTRWKQSRLMFTDQEKGGMWRSKGEFVAWSQLCRNSEDKLYI